MLTRFWLGEAAFVDPKLASVATDNASVADMRQERGLAVLSGKERVGPTVGPDDICRSQAADGDAFISGDGSGFYTRESAKEAVDRVAHVD